MTNIAYHLPVGECEADRRLQISLSLWVNKCSVSASSAVNMGLASKLSQYQSQTTTSTSSTSHEMQHTMPGGAPPGYPPQGGSHGLQGSGYNQSAFPGQQGQMPGTGAGQSGMGHQGMGQQGMGQSGMGKQGMGMGSSCMSGSGQGLGQAGQQYSQQGQQFGQQAQGQQYGQQTGQICLPQHTHPVASKNMGLRSPHARHIGCLAASAPA